MRTLPPKAASSPMVMSWGSLMYSVLTKACRPIFMPMAFRNQTPKGVRVTKGRKVNRTR